jgi:hypothetical protein
MCAGIERVIETWSEEVEEEIMGEKVRVEYQINVLELHEEGLIQRLRLTRWEKPAAERFVIEFWGNKLTVTWLYKPNVFSAFLTRATLEYHNSFEEIPWWAIPSELGDFIGTLGVKKAYYEILEYLRVLFSEPFEEVE